MSSVAHIDTNWFVVQNGQSEVGPDQHVAPLRCASLCKPLLAWSASHLSPFRERAEWLKFAEPAITSSSNAATDTLWRLAGAAPLLHKLNTLTGVNWAVAADRPSWGAVRITAHSVAQAYASLVRAVPADSSAAAVVELMKQVDPAQSFGLHTCITSSLAAEPAQLALKCGWYIDEDTSRVRTHCVTILQLGEGHYAGAVVLTSLPYSADQIDVYTGKYKSGSEVLPMHEAMAGAILRSETTRFFDSLRRDTCAAVG